MSTASACSEHTARHVLDMDNICTLFTTEPGGAREIKHHVSFFQSFGRTLLTAADTACTAAPLARKATLKPVLLRQDVSNYVVEQTEQHSLHRIEHETTQRQSLVPAVASVAGLNQQLHRRCRRRRRQAPAGHG